MYLTRIKLDLRNAQVRRDLGNPYDMHRTLVRAFVPDSVATPPRILWRAEPTSLLGHPVLLVQSVVEPDWQVFKSMPGYSEAAVEMRSIDLKDLIRADARYRFRLYANPTIARGGKRFGIASEEAQIDWLKRQGLRHGFAVEAALVTASDVLSARKGEMRLSLQRVCFEGILQAMQVEILAEACCSGIGPGKGLGLGMLSMARV